MKPVLGVAVESRRSPPKSVMPAQAAPTQVCAIATDVVIRFGGKVEFNNGGRMC